MSVIRITNRSGRWGSGMASPILWPGQPIPATVQRARGGAEGNALGDSKAIARLLLRAEAVTSSKIERLEVGGRRLMKAQLAGVHAQFQLCDRAAVDGHAQRSPASTRRSTSDVWLRRSRTETSSDMGRRSQMSDRAGGSAARQGPTGGNP